MAKYMDDEESKHWTGLLNPFWAMQALTMTLPEESLRVGVLGLVSYLVEFNPGEKAAPVEILDVVAQYAVQGHYESPGSELFEPISDSEIDSFIQSLKQEDEDYDDE